MHTNEIIDILWLLYVIFNIYDDSKPMQFSVMYFDCHDWPWVSSIYPEVTLLKPTHFKGNQFKLCLLDG